MNPPESDPLDNWINYRREELPPVPSSDFADTVIASLPDKRAMPPTPFHYRLLRLAALIVVGIVGVLRMELISLFILTAG